MSRYTRPETELIIGRRVYDNMLYRRQMGRKCHVQIFPDRIGHKMLSLPEKIMMMGDGGHPGFRYHLGEGDAEGQVKRDRQGILRYQKFNIKFFNKSVNLILQNRG